MAGRILSRFGTSAGGLGGALAALGHAMGEMAWSMAAVFGVERPPLSTRRHSGHGGFQADKAAMSGDWLRMGRDRRALKGDLRTACLRAARERAQARLSGGGR